MENRKQPENPIPPTTPTPLAVDTSQSLGQRFKQAREKKGLTLEQAAEQTFILKRHLEALESNNYESLPQLTFARGFATNYGRFLGLDSQVVSQSFEAQYPANLRQQHESVIRAPMQPMGTLNRESRSGVKINPFIIIGILAALGLAFFIFSTVNKAHKDNQPETSTASVTGMTPQDQVTGASLTNAGSAIVTTEVPASGLPATGSAITSVPVGSAVTALPASGVMATAGSSTLDIWVQKPTTVNITDANGQVLMQGEQNIGSKILQGQPPFNVTISNVKTVSIDLNKQPIKLRDYAQADNQASFSLKP